MQERMKKRIFAITVLIIIGFTSISIVTEPPSMMVTGHIYYQQPVFYKNISVNYTGNYVRYLYQVHYPDKNVSTGIDFTVDSALTKVSQNISFPMTGNSIRITEATLTIGSRVFHANIIENATLLVVSFNGVSISQSGQYSPTLTIILDPVWEYGPFHVSGAPVLVSTNFNLNVA